MIINLDKETIYEFARLSFLTKSYRSSYLSSFNDYYLQEYIKFYKKLSIFKFNLFKKLNTIGYSHYVIDVANLRIIFQGEKK